MNELKNSGEELFLQQAVDKAIGRCMTVKEWKMVEDFCESRYWFGTEGAYLGHTDRYPSIQCIVDECF